MLRRIKVIVLVILFAGGFVGVRGFEAPPSLAEVATPAPEVTSRVFGQATPVAIADPALALGLVTVAPGAGIPRHEHPGTQIGTIARGDLTYTVESGQVLMRRAGAAPDALFDPIRAGETVILHAGDTLIEQPGNIHHAHNAGVEPVEIWLATLFPADAPRARFVDAAPAATPAA
ncbi:MAG: cupin domain-containing protein [Thermomicrobiales bacterium]|nr:cupin domain-containing protein [Thermomicrobiales bacterium]